MKTLSNLYFLLIHADGNVSENEITRGKQMMLAEGIDESQFNRLTDSLKVKNRLEIYQECVTGLRKLDTKSQIRSIAWLCVIANADGFMAKEEWMLIYKIYQTELNLKLDDIMKVQKDLNRTIHGKAFHSLGVKMDSRTIL